MLARPSGNPAPARGDHGFRREPADLREYNHDEFVLSVGAGLRLELLTFKKSPGG